MGPTVPRAPKSRAIGSDMATEARRRLLRSRALTPPRYGLQEDVRRPQHGAARVDHHTRPVAAAARRCEASQCKRQGEGERVEVCGA